MTFKVTGRKIVLIEVIATQLYLSEGTVRNHISTVIQKLNVQNRIEAAHFAKEKGWV